MGFKTKPYTEKAPGAEATHAEETASQDTAVDRNAPLDEKAARRADGKRVLDEVDCYDELGFGFSSVKKWYILTVIFMVQISMNLK